MFSFQSGSTNLSDRLTPDIGPMSEWVCDAGRQELAAGEAAAAQGRAEFEAKLGALTNRLLHMARKEAKREKRRGKGPTLPPGLLHF